MRYSNYNYELHLLTSFKFFINTSQILNKEGDHYKQTRLLIYGLLSGEGSAKAQQVN